MCGVNVHSNAAAFINILLLKRFYWIAWIWWEPKRRIKIFKFKYHWHMIILYSLVIHCSRCNTCVAIREDNSNSWIIFQINFKLFPEILKWNNLFGLSPTLTQMLLYFYNQNKIISYLHKGSIHLLSKINLRVNNMSLKSPGHISLGELGSLVLGWFSAGDHVFCSQTCHARVWRSDAFHLCRANSAVWNADHVSLDLITMSWSEPATEGGIHYSVSVLLDFGFRS